MLSDLLHRIARRCPTHDRASYVRTSALERDLGMKPSTPPASLVEQFSNPEIIGCGNTWCTHSGTW